MSTFSIKYWVGNAAGDEGEGDRLVPREEVYNVHMFKSFKSFLNRNSKVKKLLFWDIKFLRKITKSFLTFNITMYSKIGKLFYYI